MSFSLRVSPLPGRLAECELLIAFADLTAYTVTTRRLSARDAAAFVDELYERSHALIEPAGGRLVKFIGDAALVVFPPERAEAGVLALLNYKRELDAWLEAIGYPGRLMVKAHFGSVVAGEFGPAHARRYDLIGDAVNLTARLESHGFAMTAQAFRVLGSEARKHFKKHTPPITYIPLEQPHA